MTSNPPSVIDAASVDAAITSRMSARAFLPQPVPRETIEHILEVARRAPSGTNTQPWRVHVLKGAVLGKLVDAVCAAFDAADGTHTPEYNYYPPEFFEPYLGRRRKVGWDLYSRIGIAKGDGARMKQLVDGFNASQGDYKIETTTLNWGEPFYTKLKTASAMGSGPDMATIHLSKISGLTQTQGLEPAVQRALAQPGMAGQFLAGAAGGGGKLVQRGSYLYCPNGSHLCQWDDRKPTGALE